VGGRISIGSMVLVCMCVYYVEDGSNVIGGGLCLGFEGGVGVL